MPKLVSHYSPSFLDLDFKEAIADVLVDPLTVVDDRVIIASSLFKNILSSLLVEIKAVANSPLALGAPIHFGPVPFPILDEFDV
mmetsp:Transcript_41815/g.63912  ORF Transcript_41815/g.63912 Transcript_41815/m.63912 type:complete len:84 (+) Transcript_41815:213-464(+)